MKKNVNVNIRMDEDLKREAEELFSCLGMNMTTAINVFVRQSVNRGGIPFEIVRNDDFYNYHNMKALDKSIKQLESGKYVSKDLLEATNE